jgi:hypothetical protein
MAGIGFVEIETYRRGIADGEIAVDQHRDSPERAQPLELVVAKEGRDRVDLVLQPLQVETGEDLADVRADEASDDRERLGHEVGMPRRARMCNGPRHAAFVALQL